MERNGWTFSSSMQHRPNLYNNTCSYRNTWYGKAKRCFAFVKATFHGQGKAILRYTNCNPDSLHPSRSIVSLLQSDDIEENISNESRGKETVYQFDFSPTKYIKLSLDCNSVVKIISLRLICRYYRLYYYC